MLDHFSHQATKDLIANLPPAPSPDLSDKYMFIDTRKVIDDMRDLGFEVAGARRPAFRTKAGAFGLHEIDFRRPADMEKSASEAPRVLFLNTYDGSRRAQIVSGIIRFICTNGLLVGDLLQNQKFLHMGDYEEELLAQIKGIGDVSNKVFGKVDEFKTLKLDRVSYKKMAEEAKAMRPGNPTSDVPSEYLLMPRRREDKSQDLWTTWNVLQENLLKGGVPSKDISGNIRTSRPLTQIQASNDLNKGLWNLLEKYAA